MPSSSESAVGPHPKPAIQLAVGSPVLADRRHEVHHLAVVMDEDQVEVERCTVPTTVASHNSSKKLSLW